MDVAKSTIPNKECIIRGKDKPWMHNEMRKQIRMRRRIHKIAIVHFKRLGSRHIHKEIEISLCVFGFNVIICETGLKPNSDTYTQLQYHQRRTL